MALAKSSKIIRQRMVIVFRLKRNIISQIIYDMI